MTSSEVNLAESWPLRIYYIANIKRPWYQRILVPVRSKTFIIFNHGQDQIALLSSNYSIGIYR
jgi:hypothetical protein